MPIRDLVVTAVVLGLLPACFLRPWIGILVWSWIGYMNPHRLTWGFAYSMPFAQMVAIATLAGLVVSKERNGLPRSSEVWLLGAFWAMITITSVFAQYPAEAWAQWIKVSKILLMTFLTVLLLQQPERVKGLLWVIGLSIGFYGFKGGIFGLTKGGASSNVLGPPGTFIAGNTEIGLALNMALPIILYLSRDEKRAWVRHLLGATFLLSIAAILFTFSRGALLGLAVVLSLLFLKSRSKVFALTLLLLGLPVLASTLPDQWFGRMETIQTYEKDSSAMGRLKAWEVATRIASDYPLVGGGFRTFTREVFQRYGHEKGLDAHSIYFQVLGEHGWPGLLLYLALILSTLLTLRRLARRSQSDPSKRWIPGCAQMVEASLVAYLVSGAFLSMSYFDLFYALVAIAVLLKVLEARPTPATNPVPAPAATRRVPAVSPRLGPARR